MKRLVEFDVGNGETIIAEVEVSADTEPGIVPAGRPGELISKATMTLGDAFDRLRPVADATIDRLRRLQTRPREIELELGVKFSAQAGVVLAAAATEANCTVRIRWHLAEQDLSAPQLPGAPPASQVDEV